MNNASQEFKGNLRMPGLNMHTKVSELREIAEASLDLIEDFSSQTSQSIRVRNRNN